jgi:16S rRNA G527 N7-methylase RsmG
MIEVESFRAAIEDSFDNKTFVKITLSKPKFKSSDLLNVYVRPIKVKNEVILSFTLRFATNDQTKNYTEKEGIGEVIAMIENLFLSATLFTTEADITLLASKKGHYTLQKNRPSQVHAGSLSHDREKVKRSKSTESYLQLLGISNKNGDIIPSMADKYRQINKYLEIIESQLATVELPNTIHIVDMGSGKGYLTFALYDFLKNKKGLDVNVTGIELRQGLVDYCNQTASACGFENLNFVCERIENYHTKEIDILIALHACDIATDYALFKAIISNTRLIVCAPCCHKQVRQQVKGKEQKSALLKYGIFKERQFEMVTDTIRALILEKNHYATNIFEFVSNEHTRKNIMLIGAKTKASVNDKLVDEKISAIKEEYHIDYQELELLLEKS